MRSFLMSELIAILEPFCYFQTNTKEVVFINELNKDILYYNCNISSYIFENSKTAFAYNRETCHQTFLAIIEELKQKKYLSVYPREIFSKSFFFDKLPMKFDPNLSDWASSSMDAYPEFMQLVKVVCIYPDVFTLSSDSSNLWKQIFAPIIRSDEDKLDLNLLKSFIKALPFSTKSIFYICSNNAINACNTVEHLHELGIAANKIIVRSIFSDSSMNMVSLIKNRARLEFLVASSMYQSNFDYFDTTQLRFLVKDKKDLNVIKNTKKHKNVKWLPIADCTGENTFFRDEFKISKEVIHTHEHTIRSIKFKNEYNINLFGILHILPDGTILDSPNGTSIGSIYNDTPVDVLKQCLAVNSSWLQTRKRVEPCTNCIYCNLCPSISEYERCLGDYALCSQEMFANKKD